MSSGSEGDGRGPPPQPLQHGCQFIDPSLARPARHHCRCRTALSPSPLPLQYPSRASPDETESTVCTTKQHNNYHFKSVEIVILRSLKVRRKGIIKETSSKINVWITYYIGTIKLVRIGLGLTWIQNIKLNIDFTIYLRICTFWC